MFLFSPRKIRITQRILGHEKINFPCSCGGRSSADNHHILGFTVISELFLGYDAVTAVKHAIVKYGLVVLIAFIWLLSVYRVFPLGKDEKTRSSMPRKSACGSSPSMVFSLWFIRRSTLTSRCPMHSSYMVLRRASSGASGRARANHASQYELQRWPEIDGQVATLKWQCFQSLARVK